MSAKTKPEVGSPNPSKKRKTDKSIRNLHVIHVSSKLFSYFNELRVYINIMATSRSNPIKNALIDHFKKQSHFYFPFDTFSGNELISLMKFFPNIESITINQYQRQFTQDNADEKIRTESKDDLTDFLDFFAAQCPKLSKRLVTIRLFTLFFDKEYGKHYRSGGLTPIEAYSKHLIPSDAMDAQFEAYNLKYPRLKCFISNGDWNNRITPKHIEYISNESHSLCAIDIHNMIPTNNPDNFTAPKGTAHDAAHQTTVFKQIFAKHRDLTFVRVRISQTFECAFTPSIAPADFEDAHLDKLKILMIQNSVAFSWTYDFVKSLMNQLNPDVLRFLYLTWDGSRVSPFYSNSMWQQFRSKFDHTLVQKKDLRNKWHIVMDAFEQRGK
eukprot:124255_1